MSNINWELDTITLRKQLLSLTQLKLVKLCKSKKLSTNGTKADLVQRLLIGSQSRKSKHRQKKHQKRTQTQKKTTKTKKRKPKHTEKDTSQQQMNQEAIQGSENQSVQQITQKPLPSISDLSKKIEDIEDCRRELLNNNLWLWDQACIDEDECCGPIVIDNGTRSIKAGFSGDKQPRAVVPTIVGHHRYHWNGVMVGMGIKDFYVGDECVTKRGILCVNYPIENGIICDMDRMEKVWHHTLYNELRIQPEEHVMLLTEPCCNTPSVREKTIRIMFETFCVPAVYLATQSALSLYALGKTTGIVLQSGESITRSVPIYEGHCLKNAVRELWYGGRHVVDYFSKLLQNNRGYSFTTSAEREMVRDMKEQMCYVAWDDHKDGETNYELPDGEIITVGEEKHKALEILFTPNIMDNLRDEIGIHEMIYQSVNACSSDMRNEMYNNIVLSGGNTMFQNMGQRLLNEMEVFGCNNHVLVDGYLREYYSKCNNDKQICGDIVGLMYKYAPSQCNIIGSDVKRKDHLTWTGGSILASTSSFIHSTITKADFDIYGESIVHRKCF
eukprot:172574_1